MKENMLHATMGGREISDYNKDNSSINFILLICFCKLWI